MYVHANSVPEAETHPVMVYEGSFEGSPGLIALACRAGTVTIEALLAGLCAVLQQ